MSTLEETKSDDLRKPIECVPVKLPIKEDKGKFAIVLYNVYTSEECEKLIADTEAIGYIPAVVNIGNNAEIYDPDYRRSDRCLVDSFEYADDLWRRVKEHIPATFGNPYGPHIKRTVVGINERFRFLRYNPGDFFKAHWDGCYRRDNGDRTYLTIQLYLNEGFKGGATTFLYDDNGTDKDVAVVPKTGMVLVFQHDIYHEGSLLKEGRKYAVRSDILYHEEQEQEDDDEDID